MPGSRSIKPNLIFDVMYGNGIFGDFVSGVELGGRWVMAQKFSSST